MQPQTYHRLYVSVKVGVILILFLFGSISISSCTRSNKQQDAGDKKSLEDLAAESESRSTKENQELAFEALNFLQLNTDEENHLYSTFAGVDHPFLPADTIYSLSDTELLTALEKFTFKNCRRLTEEKRLEMISNAVKAQEEYRVLLCLDYRSALPLPQEAPHMGTWVIPNILGSRDIVMVW